MRVGHRLVATVFCDWSISSSFATVDPVRGLIWIVRSLRGLVHNIVLFGPDFGILSAEASWQFSSPSSGATRAFPRVGVSMSDSSGLSSSKRVEHLYASQPVCSEYRLICQRVVHDRCLLDQSDRFWFDATDSIEKSSSQSQALVFGSMADVETAVTHFSDGSHQDAEAMPVLELTPGPQQ